MGALRLAQKNAAAAGMTDAIRFERADAAQVEPPPGGAGLCLVNPPWGLRLDEEAGQARRALQALYLRLGGWELAVLLPDRAEEVALPDAPADTLALQVGGIRCRLRRYRP
jgi:putative N6-adenine-specific DNA methylase